MNLKELNEKLEQIKLDKETKNALLEVINTKIESDMKEVINAIGALKNELNTFDHKLESSIGSLKESILSNRSEMTFIKWLLGGIGALALGILAKMFS